MGNSRKRQLFSVFFGLTLMFVNNEHARAVIIEIGQTTFKNNLDSLTFGPTTYKVGSSEYQTTAGTLFREIIAGPNNTTQSAKLTLTGLPGGDGIFGTADDVPFDIIFISGSPTVTINFQSSHEFATPGGPLPGLFDPIGPNVNLEGNLTGQIRSANPLNSGIILKSFAGFGSTVISTSTQAFTGPGAINQTAPLVSGTNLPRLIGGQIQFGFGAKQTRGDIVQLPGSATVIANVPVPATLSLFGLGFALLASVRRHHNKTEQSSKQLILVST